MHPETSYIIFCIPSNKCVCMLKILVSTPGALSSFSESNFNMGHRTRTRKGRASSINSIACHGRSLRPGRKSLFCAKDSSRSPQKWRLLASFLALTVKKRISYVPQLPFVDFELIQYFKCNVLIISVYGGNLNAFHCPLSIRLFDITRRS